MSVGQDYLVKKPPGPSAAKVFIDTQVVPVGVNAAGWLEVALDRVSQRIGVRPAVILVGGMGLLCFAVVRLMRRQRFAND